jgi:adhesin/invasin
VITPAGGTWLSIAPSSGIGPGLINVTVSGAGLGPGVYQGTVSVVSGATTAQVAVTLEVRAAASPQLVIDPRAFNFIVHPGGPTPASKLLRVKNAGAGTLNWTAVATSTGNWLSITPLSGTTPATITLSVNPAGLARGHYAGSVAVTAGGKTETARVFLRILGPAAPAPTPITYTAAVQVTPRALEFCLCGGVLTPPSAAVQLSARVAGLSFTAKAVTAQGGDWLKLGPTGGPIPGAITVTPAPGSLATGLYTGAISITVSGTVSEQHSVPVTLRVSPLAEAPRLVVRPGAIAFQAVRGGANPAPQQVTVEARGAASISYQAAATANLPANWLSVSPGNGTAPGASTISVNIAGLAAGVYTGAIVYLGAGGTGVLPTTLTVFLQVLPPPAAALPLRSAAAETTGLLGYFLEPAAEFMAYAGSPQSVVIALKAPDGKPVEGARVEVTPSSGEAPFILEDAGGGLYTGIFQSLSAGPVNLTAIAVAGGASASFGLGGDLDGGFEAPVIFSGGIVNAANYAPGPTPLVPGALASLFGINLADASAAASVVPLPRELAGVKVLVGGIEAPLVSVNAGADYDQINFQVPLELSGFSYVEVVVLSGGALSAPEGIAVAPAVPALFTRNFSGAGVVAALHADYTEITAERPARTGETVLLYATGLGEVSPAPPSGHGATGLSRLVTAPEVLFGGRAARVGFAGLAPGYPGLYQLNVVIPDGLPAGEAAVELRAEGIASAEGPVIPIR